MKKTTLTHKILLIFLLVIIAIGCNDGCSCNCNGCTTRKIIDTESETIRIDGIKVKVNANKVRSTNRKLNLRSNPDLITKTTWYTANYDVEIVDRPAIKEICEHEINEDQDLEKTISEFNIKFSPNKKNFAIGRMSAVWDFYHLLAIGNPFPSGDYYFVKTKIDYNTTPSLKFNKISWNIFPETNELFDTLLIQFGNSSKKYVVNDQNAFINILSELKPGNPHDIFLINNWFNEIGSQHFTQERVQHIIKVSPEWKKIALTKIFSEINENGNLNFISYNSTLNLLLSINDKKSILEADNILFKNPNHNDSETRGYFIKRFYNKDILLKQEIRQYLISNAKLIVENFPESSDIITLEDAIDIMLEVKDEKTLNNFIQKIKIPEKQEFSDAFYISDLSHQTIEKYDKYSKKLQSEIVKKYTIYLKTAPDDISQFDVQTIYEFLKDKISCTDSNIIYEKYKNAMTFSKKPKKC